MRRLLAFAALPFLAACVVSEAPSTAPQEPRPQVTRSGNPQTLADFRAVVRRVEPVAERACRSCTSGVNCDFDIRIDSNPQLGANAYQTYDRSGRPILAFTPALLRQMMNRDEIAFAVEWLRDLITRKSIIEDDSSCCRILQHSLKQR